MDDDWTMDEVLRTLADSAVRRLGEGVGHPQEGRRLRSAVKWARDHLAAQPRPVEGCVVGGCTGVGSWRWPALDGGTVPVCERHHDAATRHVERSGLDDEEALWRARRGG